MEKVKHPSDIQRISQIVAYQSMDLLQAAHTYSGIEMALWDLLGKSLNEPVWKLLGYDHSFAKTPYFSVLFGDEPTMTLERAKEARQKGFQAAKFGWGPIGTGTASEDREHFQALEKVGKTVFSSWIPGKFLGMMWRKHPKESRPWRRQMSYGLKNLFTPMLFRNTVSLQE